MAKPSGFSCLLLLSPEGFWLTPLAEHEQRIAVGDQHEVVDEGDDPGGARRVRAGRDARRLSTQTGRRRGDAGRV
jgi:hypothetical protein